MSTSPYASPRFKEGTSPLVPPQYSPAAPRMSAVAAEMLARSVRASSGLGCASLFAPPRVAPLKRAARPLAASPEPPAPAAEELLQASAVEDGVRDFYRSVQSAKALPKSKTSLGTTMETLRRRFQGKHGYRKLHPKEVQLLALLHDAGLPVLGADTLGKVVCDATTSKWRWEFAGVLGGNCDTKEAALEELRSVRSPNPSGTTVWLNGPSPAPTDASVPAAPLGTSRARVPGRSHMPKAVCRSAGKHFFFEADGSVGAFGPDQTAAAGLPDAVDADRGTQASIVPTLRARTKGRPRRASGWQCPACQAAFATRAADEDVTARGKKRRAERQALTDGLATPLTDGPGAKMMDRTGWVPGQKLGASGKGLEEPLRPDLTHENRQGLGFTARRRF